MTSLMDTPPTKENIESYYNLLVGPEAKFKTAEDMAKGKYEGDVYIKTLERQMDEMRKDLIKEREENTLRAELEKLKDQFKQQPPQSNTTQQPAEKPQIDPNEIKSLVSNTVKELEGSKRRDANLNLIQEKLTERYGRDFQSALEQQIKALDLTIDEANELAKSKPQLFIKTFGLDQAPKQENFQTPPRSNLNTSNFKPEVKKRDWSYYQEMKQKNPKEYYSAKTNVQMHNDMMDLGEAFMTGDYSASDKELLRSLRGY